MDTSKGRSGADCFACRIMTAVGWMKPDAPRREDRKEKPLLAWGRGRSPERDLSLRAELELLHIRFSKKANPVAKLIKSPAKAAITVNYSKNPDIKKPCKAGRFCQR